MKRWGASLWVAGALCVAAAPVQAQNPPGQETPQERAETIDPFIALQREQEMERRRQEQARRRTIITQPPEPPAEEVAEDREACVFLGSVSLTGATRLSASEIAGITGEKIPGCVSGAEIGYLMKRLEAAWHERGFITTRLYVPRQNLASGVLKLVAYEGVVEAITLEGPSGAAEGFPEDMRLLTAFPLLEGEIFQLRDFEQGLDQMNRLKSVDARMRLSPGEAEGASRVTITHFQDDRLRFRAGWDNGGSAATGEDRVTLSLEVDDMFFVNDGWSVSYVGTRDSNALSGFVNVPFANWLLGGSVSWSDYLTPLNAFTELYGEGRFARVRLERSLYRDSSTQLHVQTGVNVRESARYVNEAALTPLRLSVLSLGAKVAHQGTVRWFAEAAVHRGMGWLNADEPVRHAPRNTPDPQFSKASLNLSLQIPLGPLGLWLAELQGQISPDTLHSAEQTALGGAAFVRAWEESVVSGENGLTLRNSLYLAKGASGENLNGLFRILSEGFAVYLFLDAGYVRDSVEAQDRWATGGGAGITMNWGRTALEASLAIPFAADPLTPKPEPILSLKASYQLF